MSNNEPENKRVEKKKGETNAVDATTFIIEAKKIYMSENNVIDILFLL